MLGTNKRIRIKYLIFFEIFFFEINLSSMNLINITPKKINKGIIGKKYLVNLT